MIARLKKILLLLAVTAIALLATLGYSTLTAHSTVREIRLKAANNLEIREDLVNSHLWFEELLEGDTTVDENKIWDAIEHTRSHINVLISSIETETPGFARTGKELKVLLTDYEVLTRRRLADAESSRAGSAIDQEYDAIYFRILDALTLLHDGVEASLEERMNHFRRLQVFLMGLSVLLSALLGVSLHRYETRQQDNLVTISGKNMELESGNQQLRATEQQLRASNQQLQAMNQQLTATEQQLTATNQQLLATNEQLRAADEALRMSEHQYMALFEAMAEGVALHDVVLNDEGIPVNYRIVSVNPRYESILGIPASSVVGKLATEAYGTDTPPYLSEFTTVLDTGKPYQFETYFPNMDRHFEISVTTYRPGSFATIFSDITSRKRDEARIRANDARWKILWEVSQYEHEDERDFLDFALAKVLALTESRLGYIYHYDEVKQEFELNSWSRDVMADCAITKKQTCYELEKTGIWGEAVRQRRPIILNDFEAGHPLKKGYPEGHVKLFRYMTAPVFSRDHIVAVVGVANKETDYQETDVTQLQLFMQSVWALVERREAEAAQAAMESRLQRVEGLGTLAGGIAHDFNNLLAGILGNISMADYRLEKGEDIRQYLKEAETACGRAKGLTRQLLTFAQGGAPVRKVIDLETVVRESATFALRGSNSRVEFSIGPALLPVHADQGQIGQVIQNLMLNASQSMPLGGTVRVSLHNLEREREDASLPPGPSVQISIQDQGTGIPAEHLDRIFDPYFTTKNKGNGLGLAVTHSIVRSHGGTISVSSETGTGSTFKILLPASPGAVPDAELERAGVVRGKGKVLVVDDEDMIRRTASSMLQSIGYEAHEAEEGAQALDLYRKHMAEGAPFKAVILDLTIPGGMGGVETLARLREMDPDVRAIVSSGYSNDPVMSDFRNYGFIAMAAKPYLMGDLSRAVHEAITA